MITALLMAAALAAPSAFQEPKRRDDAKTEPAPPPAVTIADRVVLRDGKTILGLITSGAAGPKVGFDMLVRREWAEAHVPDLAAKWVRNAATVRKPALAERRRRLEAWRAERAQAGGGGDRIASWIDGELKRLDDPASLDAPLLAVRIGRDGCRSAERNSDLSRRLLVLGWLSGLKDAEDRPPAEVEEAVEARGFMADGVDVPSIDRLLPMTTEPEAKWLARRAATEVAVEPGRRFLRYNNMIMPDPSDGRPANLQADPAMLLGQIGKLLDPDAGAVDPLGPELEKVAARGGTGAVVTRLDLAPDLSRVAVDVALWVRGPRGWVEFGSRNSVVRPEDVDPAVGAGIAQDPQVQSIFNMADALGLGAVTQEMKERSLRLGAATSRALGEARSAFNQEMSALAFPVLEASPTREDPAGAAPADKDPAPPGRPVSRP